MLYNNDALEQVCKLKLEMDITIACDSVRVEQIKRVKNMDISIAVLILGTIFVVAFLIHGFWSGRQEREPLIRDAQAEANASALDPIVERKFAQNQEQVTIIDSATPADIAPPTIEKMAHNEFNDGTEPEMYINAEKQIKEQQTTQAKKGFWNKVKGMFGSAEDNDSIDNNEPQQTQAQSIPEAIPEPAQQYIVRVQAPEGVSFTATDVIGMCEHYHLQLGDNDLYYHRDENNNEVFRICGGEDPYKLSAENADNTHYHSLLLIMLLPQRGQAEDNFLDTVKFAYRLTQTVAGTMFEYGNSDLPLDQTRIEEILKILQHYDKTLA